MSIAFPANKRVAVLRGDKFYDCIAFQIEDNSKISVELTNEGVLISFDEVGLLKSFINIPIEMDKISFVLVDPSQDRDKQIIGIAETHWFDESRPGKVHFLQ
jgi:hypothetical protein